MLQPPKPNLGIRLLVPVPGNKPIRLQPPRPHQYEYPKRRLAESEPRDHWFRVRTYECVDELNVPVVCFRELRCEGGVPACELQEGFGYGEAQAAAEGAIAGDAVFTVAEDVDGAEVEGLAGGVVRFRRKSG